MNVRCWINSNMTEHDLLASVSASKRSCCPRRIPRLTGFEFLDVVSEICENTTFGSAKMATVPIYPIETHETQDWACHNVPIDWIMDEHGIV